MINRRNKAIHLLKPKVIDYFEQKIDRSSWNDSKEICTNLLNYFEGSQKCEQASQITNDFLRAAKKCT